MKRFLLLTLLLFTISTGFCADYSKIDRQSETVPSNIKTAKEIARYLTRHLTSPTDKARAIYFWITHNISYDVEKSKSDYTYTNPQELVDYVLAKRKGVCSNYSALFNACCQSVGIESYVIDGYIRQNGKLDLAGHSWNAVKIDNQFYNIDATWAAGYAANGKFIQQFRDVEFMILPAEFIKTHIPLDPIWQFCTNPISFKDFDTDNFEKQEESAYFNFSDSIKTISTLNPLESLKRQRQRIIHCGISNKLILEKILYLTKRIENEELKIEVARFNNAANLFNEGVQVFNKHFSTLRNPKAPSANLNSKQLETLNLARQKTETAAMIISQIKTKDLKLNSEINTFKKTIEKQLIAIDKEINPDK
jgi:hypothetical protein